MWLVLFDIDGTLFLKDERLMTEASLAAVRNVYGLELPSDCVSQIDHPGRTSRSIFREVLLPAGCCPTRSSFPRGRGAFGCEADERRDLIRLAPERAGGWPADATVLAGDTPRDVEGTHEAGIRAVALVNDRFGARELAAADALVSRLPDLPAALAELDGSA